MSMPELLSDHIVDNYLKLQFSNIYDYINTLYLIKIKRIVLYVIEKNYVPVQNLKNIAIQVIHSSGIEIPNYYPQILLKSFDHSQC